MRQIARATVGRKDGEYIVRAWDQHGQRFEGADYYTDDRTDAYLTRVAMLYPPAARTVKYPFELAAVRAMLRAYDVAYAPLARSAMSISPCNDVE